MSRKVISILLAIAMVLTMSPVIAFADYGIFDVSLDVTYGQTEAREMLSMINELREPENAWYWDITDTSQTLCPDLNELVYDYELEEVAMQRAAEIALSYSHTRPDGSECFTAFPDSYYAVGENIAYGYDTAEEVFEAWSEADESYSGQGHRRNMLNDSVEAVAVGHVVYEGVHYWVQEFISPVQSEIYTSPCDETQTAQISVNSELPLLLSCDTSEIELSVGDSTTCPVNIELNGATVQADVTYSVADTSVAKVENGEIVALSAGETVVTISALWESVDINLTVTQASDVCQYVINADETINVDIVFDEICIVAFVPETTGIYTFSSNSDSDTYGYLYDADMNLLASNDDGDDINFSITALFTAGETYYFGCRFYGWDSGSFDVTLESHNCEITVIDPTCTKQGYTTYVCSDCGYEYISDYVEATGHVDGNLDEFCDICGESVTTHFEFEVSDAWVGEEVTLTLSAANMVGLESADLQFSFDSEHLEYVSVGSTSDSHFSLSTGGNPEDGMVTFSFYWLDSAKADSGLCELTFKVLQAGTTTVSVTCNSWEGTETTPDDLSVDITPNFHDYIATVTEPTCTEEGYTTYVCSDCGYEYISDYVEATGHVDDNLDEFCDICGESVTTHFEFEVSDAWVGEEVTLTLSAANMAGLESADLQFSFDPEHLEYVDVYGVSDANFALWDGGNPWGGLVTFSFFYLDSAEADSGLCELTFKVLQAGTTTVSVTCRSWDGTETTPDDLSVDITPNFHDYIATVTEPTCTEEGYTTYVCSDCEYTYVDDYVDPIGHKTNDDGEVTAPTCTEQGYTSYNCSVCGETYTDDYFDAIGHISEGEGIITEATCTEFGYTTYVCSVCGESYDTDYVFATGHIDEDFNDYCDICSEFIDKSTRFEFTVSDAYVGEEVVITLSAVNMVGLESADLVFTYDPTCLEYVNRSSLDANIDLWDGGIPIGSYGNVTFSFCYLDSAEADSGLCQLTFKVLQAGTTTVSVTCRSWDGSTPNVPEDASVIISCVEFEESCIEHSYGDEEIITAPTCTESGLSKKICTVCEAEETTVLEALGHDFSQEWTVDTPATCTAVGSQSHHCTRCDEITDVTEIAVAEHVTEHSIVASTCTTEGVEYDICCSCFEMFNYTVLPLAEHSYGEWTTTTEATCTEKGLSKRICTTCNAEETTEIEAKGHSYGEWTTTTEATCTEKGLSKRICTACNAEETTEIAAKGHSYVAVITDPACTQKGYTTYTCSVCSDSYAADYTEATGHSYGDWAVTKAPTFMYAGQESRSCTACTETEIREIEKLVPVTAYINADTGISVSVTDGSYEGDIIVDVNNVYDGSSYQVINAQIGNFAATVFDISTTVNGEKVQPNGTVLIKMPIPEGYSTDALVIYYLPNDGSAPEKMDSYIDGIYICFETTHFSEYAIVDESEELPVYVLGDVNNDGNINASDARTALRISAKLEEADEIQTLAADVNKDGTITAADARTILRVSAKLETF